MENSISEEIWQLKNSNLYRELKIMKPSSGRVICLGGKKYINFSSNDYLGLSRNNRVIEKASEAVKIYGAGSASSRLLSGTFEIHDELEKKLSEFKKSETSLVFPSGYQTNISVISALVRENDCVIVDRLSHASIIDGAKLSKAKLFIYEHADAGSLEKVMTKTAQFRRKLIITDALFSMDGDIAPLKAIAEIAVKYSAWLMADEAHSTGVFGKTGSGLSEYFQLADLVDIKMGTLSKALGSQGGFVAVSNEIKEYLVNKARGFIFTTALSPFCAAAAVESINIIAESDKPRIDLLTKAENLRTKLKSLGYDTLNSQSQIIPILIGDEKTAAECAKKIFENGIYLPVIRYPTVPKNKARLRISLTTEHSNADIDELCSVLKTL